MNNRKIIKWCSAGILAILLLLTVIPAEGQYAIQNSRHLPVAPIVRCEHCNVYNMYDDGVLLGFLDIAPKLWKLCALTGSNQWRQPATDYSCGRGQFHVFNSWGEFATYAYTRYDPEHPEKTLIGLLYHGINDGPFDRAR